MQTYGFGAKEIIRNICLATLRVMFVILSLMPSRADGNGNYCGTTYNDALKCKQHCPSARDQECPNGERCFSEIYCSPTSPTPLSTVIPSPSPTTSKNYCGTRFQTASECSYECPTGKDGQCPDGQRCFADVECLLPVETPQAVAVNDESSKNETNETTNSNGNANGDGPNALEVVGIIAGVLASLIAVEESVRRVYRHFRRKRNNENDGDAEIGATTRDQGIILVEGLYLHGAVEYPESTATNA